MSDRILATYLIETPDSVEQAAEALAGEQSSGTFVQVPGETESLRDRFRARVENIDTLETTDTPSLPGARPPDGSGEPARFHRAKLKVSWSLENTGMNLPTVLSTVLGNLTELREFSGLRLMNLDLPPPSERLIPAPVSASRERES